MQQILALDYGERYIGVAVTDPDGRFAVRHSVIDRQQTDALPAVRTLLKSTGATTIVVGVPLNLDGEETAQTHESLSFIEQLRQTVGDAVTVEGASETLTSVEARENLAREGSDMSQEHAEAARLILADYLRTVH